MNKARILEGMAKLHTQVDSVEDHLKHNRMEKLKLQMESLCKDVKYYQIHIKSLVKANQGPKPFIGISKVKKKTLGVKKKAVRRKPVPKSPTRRKSR